MLVSTDVAAMGLDVSNLNRAVNIGNNIKFLIKTINFFKRRAANCMEAYAADWQGWSQWISICCSYFYISTER